jgi:hypothetical protein
MANPWGYKMPEKKFSYNTIEDFYMEELHRDLGITMAGIGRMLNMLDKLNKEADKKYIYEACTHLSRLRDSVFPVEVK